jgi:hypothetical protein
MSGCRLALACVLVLLGTTTAGSAGLVCDLPSDALVHPVPSVPEPAYLQPYRDPEFGTVVTRITGDPGPIMGIPGGRWGTDVHHEYSLVQAWNADQSLLFVETNRGGGARGGSVFLDGGTYRPLFQGRCPGAECRWDVKDPDAMLYAGGDVLGRWNVRSGAKRAVATFPGYSDLTIGHYKGNTSLDGSTVVLSGRNAEGHRVAFAFDMVRGRKYPDIDFARLGIAPGHSSISPKGDLVVVGAAPDRATIFDLRGRVVDWFPEYGRPSHYDLAVDPDGRQVAVGVSKSAPDNGKVIARRLRGGAVSVLVGAGYASHTSTRDIAGGMGVSDYDYNPGWPPYMAEIDAYGLGGGKVYRLAQHHSSLHPDYEAEVHPSPSPDGLRVIFASDWDSPTGRPVSVFVIDLRDRCRR